MKTPIGKYLTAEQLDPEIYPDRKTCVWEIQGSQGYVLGTAKWYGPWRKYCFYPADGTLFDVACLHDLAAFLDSVQALRVQPEQQSAGSAARPTGGLFA